ncbi:MAG: hypothetical protein V4450_07250 [Bacteroidota bacterium]
MLNDPEYNQRLLDECKRLIAVTDTAIYFPDPISVKITPHTELFRCYGVVITKDDELKLMDPNEEWHGVEVEQKNAGYILQSLFQRLKSNSYRKTA